MISDLQKAKTKKIINLGQVKENNNRKEIKR